MEFTITKKEILSEAECSDVSKSVLIKLFPNAFSAEKDMESTFKVGDIVVVVDGSNNKDRRTGISRHGIDLLFTTQKAVVIQSNLRLATYHDFDNYRKKGRLMSWMYSDLLLRFETGEEVYTSSKMCKYHAKKICNMAKTHTDLRPESPINKAYNQMVREEIEELQDWQKLIYSRHRKTLTQDEHAAIGRNITQIINLLKSKIN